MAGIALALPWQESLSNSIAIRLERTGLRWAPLAGTALGWLASGVLISAAATLATFPLVALNFGQAALLGIPATILATPLLPFALAGGTDCGGGREWYIPCWANWWACPRPMPLSALLGLVEIVPKWTVEPDTERSGWLWAWYAILLGTLVLADTRWYQTDALGRLNRGFESKLHRDTVGFRRRPDRSLRRYGWCGVGAGGNPALPAGGGVGQ